MNRPAAFPFGFRRASLAILLFSAVLLCVAAVRSRGFAASGPPSSSPEWFTVNLDYSSQRYVDLDQITTRNVDQLTRVCELELNTPAWFSSGLLMVGGTLYVNTVNATVALDAATCEERWTYRIQSTGWMAAVANRGAAFHDGAIIRGTADGRVMAIDARTGTLRWQAQGADPTRQEAFTSAPVAWNGKVFMGIVTADLGVRGRIQAFDTRDGRELWRFNTIPVGIEPGAETWPSQAASGGHGPAGGAFWTSYSLDPATGEVFGPVSNPNPDYVRSTAGYSNLYTNSVISLDAATGGMNWHCQTISGDTHDWDLGTQPTLYRTRGGRQMLAIAGKEGYVIGIDRSAVVRDSTCQRRIVFRTPGTRVPERPEPPVDESLRHVCPGTVGGAQWNGTAYHPGLGVLYSGMVDFCAYYSSVFYGGDAGFWENENSQTVRPDFSQPPRGWITAMDGETGAVLWKHQTDAQVLAGLVPTAGGLLFGGDTRGTLYAFNARTGALLKRIDTGGALNHGLISYAANGRQYVAAAAGGLTLNPAGVSGPLRVVVYGLPERGQAFLAARNRRTQRIDPSIVTSASDAPPAPGGPQGSAAGAALYSSICAGCHGFQAEGSLYPPLLRHTELASDSNDYQVLKDFLGSVPPPMPILYPGLLNDEEVEAVGAYLRTLLGSAANPQLPNSAPLGYVYRPPSTGGSPQWQRVYSVLTSPRCINCHTVTSYPRQRDIRYPHIYAVVRGTDDQGAPVARCTQCHHDQNDPRTGVPGAPDWQLAPLSMAWESTPGIAMTGAQLCAMLKDRTRNGDRNLDQLLKHMTTPLVEWAWHPGTRWNGEPRTTPPISHAEFLEAFRRWAEAGAPCPAQ